jgi:hypothetical protein
MHDISQPEHHLWPSVTEWQQLMRLGEYAAAWQISDRAVAARRGISQDHLPFHLRSVWDGRPVADKRVLVRCFHGIGDTIQFARFIEPLLAVAADVTVCASGPLVELLSTAPFINDKVRFARGEATAAYDADVEMMELAHVFRTTLETIPGRIPYLDASPAHLPGREGFSVGLAWRSGDWDGRRSLTVDDLLPLFDVEGVTFYSVQLDAEAAGWRYELGRALPVDGLLRTAGVIKALDLLITVDTMTAHLAGALGRPVLTLLHADADWRWMQGPTTPWYPTMRLFRQQIPGVWSTAVEDVAEALRQCVLHLTDHGQAVSA